MIYVFAFTEALVRPPTTASHVIEESTKLSTSTFLTLGLIFGLLHAIKLKNKKY